MLSWVCNSGQPWISSRKFSEPLYGKMMETGKEEMTKNIYRKNYHPLAQTILDKLVMKNAANQYQIKM